MAITKTRKFWRGDNLDDLAAYVRQHRAGGYPVQHVKAITCRQCPGDTFRVMVDDDEGCALTVCLDCQTQAPIADSADHLDDAELGECACPCGNETFGAAVGFAMTADDEVRWISVGLRCLADGTLGVYTDWKIDYLPSAHLLADA